MTKLFFKPSHFLIFICLWLLTCENPKRAIDSRTPVKTSEITYKRSIGRKLQENNHLPVSMRVALYHRLKKENPEAYNFENEDDMTMYGYSLLWDEKVAEALEIFKLIVSEFPDSSNPYDSLGEAWLANGDKDKALANYEKSLALNPENVNAIDQIARIKGIYKMPEQPENKFDKVYSAQSYKDDLDQLGKKLAEIHPNVYKFTPKADFDLLMEEKKAQITEQTTYGEFAWICREIIASVNCSHTSFGGFYVMWEMLPTSLRFPLVVCWLNEGLYVVDPLNNGDKISPKDQILSINGIAATDLVSDIYKHIPSQGFIKTYKKYRLNDWAPGMIPYALNFPEVYEIVIEGKAEPIILNPTQSSSKSFAEPFKKPCPEQLCLEFLDNDKTAILTIASFNYYWWNNLDEFIYFIDDSFVKIKDKGVKNLVVDVRFNGGGSYHSSIHLLRYLVEKPFVYYSNIPFDGGTELQQPFKSRFQGDLYFLIDGNGNSTTGHFMSIVKDLNLGTIVGEELGSNQFCTAGQTICRLPNTGLEYYVANSTCISSATSLPAEKGILPDHYITQSIDDYVGNIDRVREFVVGLVGD